MDNLFNEENQKPEKKNSEKETIKLLNNKVESLSKENDKLKKENAELSNHQEELIRLKPDKTFGLNVCGDVMLNKIEVEIVNTEIFQRLGFVNQLGSTNTVYRSANHTRFEHSLGVLKMADLMIHKIINNKHSEPEERKISPEEEQIIRLLALLHDIGHMPFGHTIEDEFNIFQSHDKHESRWQYFLGADSTIGKIILRHRGKDFHNRFFRLIKCEKNFKNFENDAFMYDIVSNTVCADLLDYLHRDCQYTNLKLNFHPRFLDYLIIKKVKSEHPSNSGSFEKRIVIRLCKTRNKEARKDIQSELVQLIRNRYYLGERVYYHHTKIKTGTLIAGAVLRAKESESFKLLEGYEQRTYADGDGPMYELHTWGDVELLINLKNLSENKQGKNPALVQAAKYLTTSFMNRVVYYQFHGFSKKDLKLNENLIKEIIEKKTSKERYIKEKRPIPFELKLIDDFGNATSRLHFEEQISELLPEMNSGDFLIYFPNYKMQMKLAEVKVEGEDGIARPLKDCGETIIEDECKEIIAKHQNIWKLRVLIHPRFIAPTSVEEKINYKELYGHEYKAEYKSYLHIIEKYCKWIFAKEETDIKEFSADFWKDVFEFTLDNELDSEEDSEPTSIYNPTKSKSGKKNRTAIIAELAEEFAGDTMAKRTRDEVLNKLENRFKENHRK
jgi:HD superfamily phosphohydrolase